MGPQDCVPSGGSQRESISWPFAAARGLLHSSPRVPSSYHSSLCFHSHIYFLLCYPCPRYKDLCDCVRATQSHLQNAFCHVRSHIHRFWELGCGHLGGGVHYPAYHTSPLRASVSKCWGYHWGPPTCMYPWGLAIGKAQGHLKVTDIVVSWSSGCRHLPLLGLQHNTIPPCCCGLISKVRARERIVERPRMEPGSGSEPSPQTRRPAKPWAAQKTGAARGLAAAPA